LSQPISPKQAEEKAKRKPGGMQHPNPPDTNNPERNWRDAKGRGGSK
jgi:hypothetical protein